MKKTTTLILLASTHLAFSGNVSVKDWDPKPMIEGNRRVDEVMEWNKNHPGEMPPLTEEEKYEYFIKDGIPLPGTGATVVDAKTLKFNAAQSSAVRQFNKDQETKGYFEQTNNRAKNLLNMPETAEKEYNTRKSIAFNPYDTHLYEVKNNMQMAYEYQGVPAALATKVIGYAPESTFINKGWAGAVEFFVPSFGGVCAFHEVNIEFTKSSAYIPKEIATYKVNKKLTKMNAIGNKESGFVYEIEWWDKKFKRTLECAAKEYTDAMRTQTLELAKQIDKA